VAAMVEQGISFAFVDTFYFADKDGVVASHVLCGHIARQPPKRSPKQRDAGVGPFKLHIQLPLLFGRRMRFGEMLRESLLITAQNVDAEPPLHFQKGKQLRLLIHAHENQKRIERNGSKGIGGHAMHFARFALHGDNRYPSSEITHYMTEEVWAE
jgi:hypothetical protein